MRSLPRQPPRGPTPRFTLHHTAAELITNARAIAGKGKGILAADESTGTIGKKVFRVRERECVRVHERVDKVCTTQLAKDFDDKVYKQPGSLRPLSCRRPPMHSFMSYTIHYIIYPLIFQYIYIYIYIYIYKYTYMAAYHLFP